MTKGVEIFILKKKNKILFKKQAAINVRICLIDFNGLQKKLKSVTQ
jgi:hypothetical protein